MTNYSDMNFLATANNAVNTVTSPRVPAMSIANSTATSTSTPCSSVAVPTVGQVPTTVHTVPLITTVNGQWTFSLQPVMSVGGVDVSITFFPILIRIIRNTTSSNVKPSHAQHETKVGVVEDGLFEKVRNHSSKSKTPKSANMLMDCCRARHLPR